MALTKSELKALTRIFKGDSTRKELAKSLNVTVNRLSPLLECLKYMDFIEITRKNRNLIIRPSKTQHAYLFKKLLILEPGTKYEDFLYGLNFKLLSYCLHSRKPIENIARQLNISKKTVMNRSLHLRNRQLLNKKDRMLMFNKQTWPDLYDFLTACRNYAKHVNNILWKFEDEMIFEVSKEEIQGTLTGFSAYPLFKVPMNVIKYACYLPAKKLSKEEVFIHSLLQIRKETRLLELAAVFYYKNKLIKNKLYNLAIKFDCLDKLQDFYAVLKTKQGEVETATLPLASSEGINEMLNTYGART